MKPYILLIFVLIISGCVIYPAKHVSEPRYEVSVIGEDFSRIEISSSLDAKDGTCEGGKILALVEENKYISEEEYGWLKAAFFVPVDSYKPIKICAVSKDGEKHYWTENVGVFGSDYPKIWRFNCKLTSGKLSCEKII